MDVPMYKQQAEFCSETATTGERQHGTVKFFDQNEAFNCNFAGPMDSTRGSADDVDTSYENWWQRPVKVKDIEFALNDDLPINDVINVWEAWFADPFVIRKIQNFRNFRGKMRVKIVLNGNGFYWGSIMASYLPIPADVGARFANFTHGSYAYSADAIQASQRPHILLDPSSNQGGEMTIPFFWPRDNVDMTNGDTGFLGVLWLTTLTRIQSTNTSLPVTGSVFVWMEDVTLSGPTATSVIAPTAAVRKLSANGLYVPQAKMSKEEFKNDDEYGKGLVDRKSVV